MWALCSGLDCSYGSRKKYPRCNEARRMSEGALVMPSCSATNLNNNGGGGGGDRTAVLPRRKFSFPAVLQSQGLYADLGSGGGGGGPSLTVASARRRFSNVSDVVSRKLSHTIGWRTAVPTEQIARHGKALCAQYVRWKLKRAGVYTKKCAGALRCASSGSATPASCVADVGGFFVPPQAGEDSVDSVRREVFPAVLRVGLQLERLDPKPYTAGAAAAVSRFQPSQRQLGHRRQAYRRNSTTAAVVLVSVSRELFRAGAQVTWAKVVSLMCVSAGLAVDSARRGRGEQLTDLIETFGEVVEDDLAAWIHYNGGWMGLESYCKPVEVNVENPVSTHIRYLVSLLIVVILFLLLLRWSEFISVFR